MSMKVSLLRNVAALTILSLVSAPVSAQQALISQDFTQVQTDQLGRDYCYNRNLGHWFYCSRPAPKKIPGQPPSEAASSASDGKTEAERQVEKFQKRYEALRAEVATNPTPESVVELMRMNTWAAERAQIASDMMQRLLWQNPELDYTLRVPMDQTGTLSFRNEANTTRVNYMQNVRERYGVFFFYMSTCPHCHRFAPVLANWSRQHDIEVRAISMDGGPMEGFPDARADNGLFARFGLTGRPVPAIVLYDTVTKKATPISFGFLSQDELERRIYTLTATQPGADF